MAKHPKDDEPIGRDGFGAPLYPHQIGQPGSPDGPPVDRLVKADLEPTDEQKAAATRIAEVVAIITFLVVACGLVSGISWLTVWFWTNLPS